MGCSPVSHGKPAEARGGLRGQGHREGLRKRQPLGGGGWKTAVRSPGPGVAQGTLSQPGPAPPGRPGVSERADWRTGTVRSPRNPLPGGRPHREEQTAPRPATAAGCCWPVLLRPARPGRGTVPPAPAHPSHPRLAVLCALGPHCQEGEPGHPVPQKGDWSLGRHGARVCSQAGLPAERPAPTLPWPWRDRGRWLTCVHLPSVPRAKEMAPTAAHGPWEGRGGRQEGLSGTYLPWSPWPSPPGLWSASWTHPLSPGACRTQLWAHTLL